MLDVVRLSEARAAAGEAAALIADPERAAAFGLTLVFSTLESGLLFGELRSGALVLTDDDLAAELTRAYLAYLGATHI